MSVHYETNFRRIRCYESNSVVDGGYLFRILLRNGNSLCRAVTYWGDKMTRLWIHTLVILSATGLTTLIFYKPEAIQGEALEVVKYAITSLWTLVAIIVRDNRNRGMRNDKGDNK